MVSVGSHFRLMVHGEIDCYQLTGTPKLPATHGAWARAEIRAIPLVRAQAVGLLCEQFLSIK